MEFLVSQRGLDRSKSKLSPLVYIIKRKHNEIFVSLTFPSRQQIHRFTGISTLRRNANSVSDNESDRSVMNRQSRRQQTRTNSLFQKVEVQAAQLAKSDATLTAISFWPRERGMPTGGLGQVDP